MFERRKISAARSRATSRRLRSATIGTHVQRGAGFPSRRMNGDSVSFSSPRKTRRASRGVVDTLLPSAASGESPSDHARRVSQRDFTRSVQRKAHLRRVLAVACCVLAVAAVAAGAGVMAFFASVDGKLSLSGSDAKAALVPPAEASAPYYVLLAADLGAPAGVADDAGPDAFALARVDEERRAVTLVSIPANLQVVLKDGKPHRLRDAAEQGDAAVISAAASFAGVDIAHYAKADAEGIERLTERLGGIEMTLAEEIDDPAAGDVYLPAGAQSIGGGQVLTFLRASNLSDGIEARARNQCAFLAAVLARLSQEGGGLGGALLLDGVAGDFETDQGAQALLSTAERMRGLDASSILSAQVPGYEAERDGVAYFIASSAAWQQLMDTVDAGGNPQEGSASAQVDPGSFTLTIRNGAGVAGGAAQMREQLEAQGFVVEEVGNTSSAAYDETLVIYKDEARESAAETVVSALGSGRVVNGGEFYEFETDVLVVLGKDWKPLS